MDHRHLPRAVGRRAVPFVLFLALLAAVAAAESPAPEVKALDTADAEARKAAAAALVALPDWQEKVLQAIWDDEARREFGPDGLAALVALVGEHRLTMAHGGLRRMVKDPDAPLEARRSAVRLLGEMGGIADVNALAEAVHDLPEEACRALADIGGESAQRALRRAAGENPPDAALAALAVFGDDGGLPALVDHLESGSGDARASTLSLLRWATGRELPDDPAAWHTHLRRRAIAKDLAQIDYDAADAAMNALVAGLESGGDAALSGDLRAILLDPAWPVFARDRAALALGLGGARDAMSDLLAACAREVPGPDRRFPGSLRLYAAEALARVGDLSVAVPLAQMLVHDEDPDRLEAKRAEGVTGEYFPVDPAFVRTLYRLGVKGGGQQIVDLLAGAYRTRMHRDCIRALMEITHGETFGYEADSPDAERNAAVERIRTWWALNRDRIPIEPRADDAGWPVFREHVGALIQELGAFKFLHQMRAKFALTIVAEPARPQLEAALGHETLHVRMGAAEVIAGAGMRAAAPALAARLAREDNAAARTKLLMALAACTGPRAEGTPAFSAGELDAIRTVARAALGDGALDVRIGSLAVLGNVGDAGDAQRIRDAMEPSGNRSPAFRQAAEKALEALK